MSQDTPRPRAGPGPDLGPGGQVDTGRRRSSASRTLVRVLLVQAATMILLWLLQSRYHG